MRTPLFCLAIGRGTLMVSCGGAAGQPAIASATSSPSTTTPTSASAAPSTATASTTKVSANHASNAELIAAFTAAGIPSPASWAREVQEYRPYDTSDTNLAKLRHNLAKYNPAAGVVDRIVATLSLP